MDDAFWLGVGAALLLPQSLLISLTAENQKQQSKMRQS
jgi:hypothetical protein